MKEEGGRQQPSTNQIKASKDNSIHFAVVVVLVVVAF